MDQDDPNEKDNIYKIDDVIFIIDREIEKDTSYMEIDYISEWWGEEFVITAGF